MANTPFLDLVKPAGTDHALVSVINSNSDKIDTGVSTLSEQIATKEINTSTSILAYAESLPAPTFKTVIMPGTNYSSNDLPSSDFKWGTAIIQKRLSTFIVVTMYANLKMPALNVYSSGTWSGWKDFNYKPYTNSLADQIANHYVDLKSSGKITLTNDAPAGTTISLAQLRYTNLFCQLDICLTNSNGFSTSGLPKIATLNLSAIGIVIPLTMTFIGSVHNNTSFIEWSDAQGFSWWQLSSDGGIVARPSVANMKVMRLTAVFKLGW